MEQIIKLLVEKYPLELIFISIVITFFYLLKNRNKFKLTKNSNIDYINQANPNIIKSKITQRKPYGLFVELPSGISGLIHVSNLHTGKKVDDYYYEEFINVEETISNKVGKYAFKAIGESPKTAKKRKEEIIKNGSHHSYYKKDNRSEAIPFYLSKDEKFAILYNTLYKNEYFTTYISHKGEEFNVSNGKIEIKNNSQIIFTKERLLKEDKSEQINKEHEEKEVNFNKMFHLCTQELKHKTPNFSGIGKCTYHDKETYKTYITLDPLPDIKVEIYEDCFAFDNKLYTILLIDDVYIKPAYRRYGFYYDKKLNKIKYSGTGKKSAIFELISNAKKDNYSIFDKQEEHNNLRYKEFHKNIPIFLNAKGINKFYHFTDIRNLESIIENGGLYSWKSIENKEISALLSSNELSRQLDTQKNLQDYIRLSFTDYHPMSTKVENEYGKNLVWLEIDLEVALWESTLYSDMNATDKNVTVKGDFDFLKTLDFDIFKQRYNTLDNLEKKKYQAEILVKDFLPIRYIKNIDELQEKQNIFNLFSA